MKKWTSAKTRRRQRPLTAELIRSLLRKLFPKKNDHVHDLSAFQELIPELARFEITDHGKFERLMKKHRRALLIDDKSRLSSIEQKYYAEWFGIEETADAVRRQYWFALPGFVRNALESEFGEDARVSFEEQDDDTA